MRIALSAAGVDSGVELFRVEVDPDGNWTYQSRAVEMASGKLPQSEWAQLKSFYDKVNWELEVLNMPVSYDDRFLFRLEVTHDGSGDRRLYQFSEAMNHASWQFRDLVHFLRHNVATKGDPVGRFVDETFHQPPAQAPNPHPHTP